MEQKTQKLIAVWQDWLETMYLIRYFDEAVEKLFLQGRIHGTTHLYIGEEAIATGACAAIEETDFISSTHRGHGHCIAKGASVNHMMAEILGRVTGYSQGRGGSMHIADVDSGNLGENGIVAGGMPIAVGAALTSQMKNTGRVVLCFFGDGATNEGAFHESLNLAAIWKLPIVFICENNQYGMSGNVKQMIAIPNISKRADSYGMPGFTVDGNDVTGVYEVVQLAVNRARSGQGPTLIEAKTYRLKGHSKSDVCAYRTREEEKDWQGREPISRLQQRLIVEGLATEEQFALIDSLAKAVIKAAVQYAENSPNPATDDLERDVYA